MPKIWCIVGMVIAVLILVLFGLDLVLTFVSPSLAPFSGAAWYLDLAFVLCAAGLFWLSWQTYKEQP
jgi:hypothetical protein